MFSNLYHYRSSIPHQACVLPIANWLVRKNPRRSYCARKWMFGKIRNKSETLKISTNLLQTFITKRNVGWIYGRIFVIGCAGELGTPITHNQCNSAALPL